MLLPNAVTSVLKGQGYERVSGFIGGNKVHSVQMYEKGSSMYDVTNMFNMQLGTHCYNFHIPACCLW